MTRLQTSWCDNVLPGLGILCLVLSWASLSYYLGSSPIVEVCLVSNDPSLSSVLASYRPVQRTLEDCCWSLSAIAQNKELLRTTAASTADPRSTLVETSPFLCGQSILPTWPTANWRWHDFSCRLSNWTSGTRCRHVVCLLTDGDLLGDPPSNTIQHVSIYVS